MLRSGACIETSPASEPVANLEHLRRVIERLPCCVVRVAIDGVLLAANDAALGLLGAQGVAQVLGKELTEWIAPEDRAAWGEFAAAVAGDASRSVECAVTDVSGVRRTVLFHGVPVLDHPDGIPSMMLGARDISTLRHLERSQEHLEQLLRAGRTHLEDQRTQLAAAAAERQRLESLLEGRQTAHERLVAEQAECERTRSEQHQLELQLKEQEAQQQLDLVRAQLTESAAERARMEGLLSASEAKQEQLARALADRMVELRYKDVTARQLAPLAAAGRLAVEVAAALQQVVEAIEARTALLLSQCPPEAAHRDEIEALRGDAIRAGSLMRQIEHARTESSFATDSTGTEDVDVDTMDA